MLLHKDDHNSWLSAKDHSKSRSLWPPFSWYVSIWGSIVCLHFLPAFILLCPSYIHVHEEEERKQTMGTKEQSVEEGIENEKAAQR